jgi:acyl-CoA oxidase
MPRFFSSLQAMGRLSRQHSKAFSSTMVPIDQWRDSFREATSVIKSDVSFLESAEQLRTLTKTNLLRATDIKNAPERFFEAHRILARHAVEHGPGFWIRFTVHYNFPGTVLAVGTDDQVAELTDFQNKGYLGCFSLTEKLAGVQSGLVVETTATWDNNKKSFILNTPHEGARKNWISQGFVADKTVVLADLIVGGQSMGPHAFIMDFRVDGELVPGITVDDMGRKTVCSKILSLLGKLHLCLSYYFY